LEKLLKLFEKIEEVVVVSRENVLGLSLQGVGQEVEDI